MGFPDSTIKKAIAASDLLQPYADIALDNIEKLDSAQLDLLAKRLQRYTPKCAYEAGGKAIMLYLLKYSTCPTCASSNTLNRCKCGQILCQDCEEQHVCDPE